MIIKSIHVKNFHYIRKKTLLYGQLIALNGPNDSRNYHS